LGPEDLSGNLVVRLGAATEALNRTGHEIMESPARRPPDVKSVGAEAEQTVLEKPVAERPPSTPKAIRGSDKEHRKFVSRQACLVCGRTPADPHHLRFAQSRALGRKVSDEFTAAVCRLHNELHRYGDEVSWWTGVNVDSIPMAAHAAISEDARYGGKLARHDEPATVS
jgi:hypothetical protein